MRRLLAPVRDEAIERAVRRSRLRIGFVLVYHGLARETGDPVRELVPPYGENLFDSQLRFLKERYRVVRASSLLEAVASRRPGERVPVSITFDDDLRSHVDRARPALLRHGLPATFFLCGASLDRPLASWSERLQRAVDRGLPGVQQLFGEPASDLSTIQAIGQRIEALEPRERAHVADRLGELVGPDPPDAGLRRRDVLALKEAGFEIGFHTLRHDPLPTLDDEALREALTKGRDELAELLGEQPHLFAYPHGRVDARVAAAVKAAGYRIGFTTTEKAVLAGDDPLLLGRFAPSFLSVRHLASKIAKTLARGGIDGPELARVDALAAAMGRLIDDPELRLRLGRQARLRVDERFSLDRVGAQFRDFLAINPQA
jgi:peptidoglycan/xylan/chitin deacetylase (PgdA/CDA1 family)